MLSSTPQQIFRTSSRASLRPWTFALFDRSPWPAWATGLALGLLLLLVLSVAELASGRPQAVLHGHAPGEVGCEHLLGDYRIGVVGIILLASSMTARYALARWTLESARRLGQPGLKDAETLAGENRWGLWPGIVGIAIVLLLAVDIAERDVEWTRAYWILPHAFNWGWCIPFGWVGGRLVFSVVANALIVSRAAERIEVNDLSDTTAFDATIRHGSRSALVSLMFLGIVSVHFMDPGLDAPAMLFLTALFVLGAVVATYPALGALRNLYDLRDRQLERLSVELETEERQLYTRDADYEPGRIADIVAMEQRLQNWRVTIFHFSNVARLLVYALVGFMSWIAAEAVSVLVEGLFGF